MDKLSIKLYENEMRVLMSLPTDIRGRIISAILSDSLNIEFILEDPTENAVFILIKAQIDRAKDLSEKRANAGRSNKKTDEPKFEQQFALADTEPENAVEISEKTVVNDIPNTISPVATSNETGAKQQKTEQVKVVSPHVPYAEIMQLYNSLCNRLPKIEKIEGGRQTAVSARFKTHGIDGFRTLFEKASKSEFLSGNNDSNWTATFDWIMKSNNFLKVIEGNYDIKTKPKQINSYAQNPYQQPLEKQKEYNIDFFSALKPDAPMLGYNASDMSSVGNYV